MSICEVLAPILALIYVFQFSRIAMLKNRVLQLSKECRDLDDRLHDLQWVVREAIATLARKN